MKRFRTILIWIAFLIGLGIFSYPTVSNWVAERNQIIATQSYINQITTLSPSQIKEEWKKAKKYNSLLKAGIVTDPFSDVNGIEPFTEYDETLDIDGIMGYVSIPTIQVKVPIYHGVSDEVLRKGAGHIKATALPIGGKGTHSVLSSHSGLPEARLFTDLEKLEQGDFFYIYVLDKELAYQIDQISVVTPDDISKLQPVKGEDFVTLLTCTPIGINDHRLLVRGKRCAIPKNAELQDRIELLKTLWWLILPIGFFIFLFVRRRHRKRAEKRARLAMIQEVEKAHPQE